MHTCQFVVILCLCICMCVSICICLLVCMSFWVSVRWPLYATKVTHWLSSNSFLQGIKQLYRNFKMFLCILTTVPWKSAEFYHFNDLIKRLYSACPVQLLAVSIDEALVPCMEFAQCQCCMMRCLIFCAWPSSFSVGWCMHTNVFIRLP